MRVKGGAVVDPASGLEDCASVVRDPHGRPLSAVLGMVDLVRGSNSYYKSVSHRRLLFPLFLLRVNDTFAAGVMAHVHSINLVIQLFIQQN